MNPEVSWAGKGLNKELYYPLRTSFACPRPLGIRLFVILPSIGFAGRKGSHTVNPFTKKIPSTEVEGRPMGISDMNLFLT